MDPHAFLTKWRHAELKERSASQSHFNDLCALLGVVDPVSADPTGEWFTFEKGASKTSGGEGWADVWRKGHFAWEYKGRRKDLNAAFSQLLQYGVALENPPLLIVSDMDRILLHTNWTNTVQEVHAFATEELIDAGARDRLRQAFTDPEAFWPRKTRQELTEETAGEFASLAQRLRERGHEAHQVAHFINRLVFCMFAEDTGLLSDNLFTRMLERSRARPDSFTHNAEMLFGAMATGGAVGFESVDWFNGGLFEDNHALPLRGDDIGDLLKAARRDWSQIDPSILGTLFERGLDPAKRSQTGAHYTDRDKIMLIVRPVIIEPLEAEWTEALARMTALVESAPRQTKDKLLRGAELAKRTKALAGAEAIHSAFIERLATFRVLDPACGSGNFLYVALRALKDIEHRANLDTEALGLTRGFPRVGPENMLGIELNPYAAELARVSVWIGEIQWMRSNGFDAAKNPILRPLDTIECRDAVLANPPRHGEGDHAQHGGGAQAAWSPADAIGGGAPPASPAADAIGDPPTPSPRPPSRGQASSGTPEESWTPDQVRGDEGFGGEEWVGAALVPKRAEWPAADVIIGNPPFLGASKHLRELGDEYVGQLRTAYRGVVPESADLVTYWFVQSLASGQRTRRVGFVSSNSIRSSGSNVPFKQFTTDYQPFCAWSDLPWVIDGAAVRVSIVCGTRDLPTVKTLDGKSVATISSALTENSQTAHKIGDQGAIIFRGPPKIGPFDVEGDVARAWLREPLNPNGHSNSDVVRPLWIANDVVRRPSDRWIIDFADRSAEAAAFYEKPFDHTETHVRPARSSNRRPLRRDRWWLHGETIPALRREMAKHDRVIVTPMVSKHRLFAWMPVSVLPDQRLMIIARSDDTTFGILQSRIHAVWTIANCSWHGAGNDPVYNAGSVFATFPFAVGLTPDIPAADYAADPHARAIADAAARLNELRENWLNPDDLVMREPEVVPGYPDRILPRDEAAAKELKKRTLTNLYNARPRWLANAHTALDEAVAEAYGWGEEWRARPLTDDEILARLFRLNQQRAARQSSR